MDSHGFEDFFSSFYFMTFFIQFESACQGSYFVKNKTKGAYKQIIIFFSSFLVHLLMFSPDFIESDAIP
jgi:hypothetical protein